MRKAFSIILLCLMVLVFSACGTENESPVPVTSDHPSSETATPPLDEQSESAESSGSSTITKIPSATEDVEEPESMSRQISVQFGENTVIYELNDGTAANSLYQQLPLTIEVEDYSTNEKIFYPPEELDTGDAPEAAGGAGVLAYYEPWGDVVMFYDDFSTASGLYELGTVTSGSENISELSGSVLIEQAE